MLSKTFALVVALIGMTGAAAAQTGGPEVSGAWARATPGKAETASVYLTISSPTGDRLTAVATPVAKQAKLHTMSMDGGVMKMRPLPAIDIPAGQAVTLKPGGLHIMLEGLPEPLHEGQTFPLTLSFEKAGSRQVAVPVEKITAMGLPGQPAAGAPSGMPMPMPH